MAQADSRKTVPGQVTIVMGTAGSGKSTIAKALADALAPNAAYLDADDFHSEENKQKMARGEPLTDEDRWPWLRRCVEEIKKQLSQTPSAYIFFACSALKKAYRDFLRQAGSPEHPIRFLYLKGSKELLAKRVASRPHHFFKMQLLDSQFATLEEPDPKSEPDVVVVSVDGTVQEVLQRAKEALGL
ncbi:thermoresistant glucokinase family carbohydrate kinase [Spizellomyces punctatus DAOM BR117]|uniref:Gluconokinase n=1 Tax=Spizellomyces punctatus (strain DAOM BR117) TaxID=645134 RepID=A0A0L0HSM3_SPIPD|nr:thermoresistant glucokinase family carbohydrate kinase [Spizellomyces punctatus DAOM BR117]KND04366.1 thermoresistant glucokinase family carbohydrate kinase [Spizellomyces punctatus DAOM BR117]|eukprot:XP_016612405.1 thermoresistant glucokinase family carbohydrate kinase [Spizellomyces punctatus DAOM BR117]